MLAKRWKGEQTAFCAGYNKMLVIRAGIHKMLNRIANRVDLDLGLHCLPRPFGQAICNIYQNNMKQALELFINLI